MTVPFNKEQVYDEQISPLVKQIINICNEEGIPMLVSFAYEYHEEKGSGKCTTIINNIEGREDYIIQRAHHLIRSGGNHVVGIK